MPEANTMTTIGRKKRRICGITTSSQIVRTCSSLLVPLMIAVFTVVTTMLQMNLAKQQREQDLVIAKENREKDLEIANRSRLQQYEIEESRRERDLEIANRTRLQQYEIEGTRRDAEAKAQENQQMNTVLAAYLKDMAELMLSTNFTLTNLLIATVVRAKTLTTLIQLDGKRKGYLVRFLYESQMMTVGQPSIDLTDADLSNVDLKNYKLSGASFVKCNLLNAIFHGAQLSHASFIGSSMENVVFDYMQLIAVSFDNSHLTNVSFVYADLTNASFIGAELSEVSFKRAIVTNTDFTGVYASETECSYMKGNNTIFNDASTYDVKFTSSKFINASFVKTYLGFANMNYAELDSTNFTDAKLHGTNFDHTNLTGSVFDGSFAPAASFYAADLVATKWLGTDVGGVDFSQANLHLAAITDDQIRRAWRTVDIILPDGSRGVDENLLQNGDAEGLNGTCETTSWHVNSVIADKYNTKTVHVFGKCHFSGQSKTTQATMRQRVQVSDEYDKWIQTGEAIIWISGYCVSTLATYVLRLI